VVLDYLDGISSKENLFIVQLITERMPEVVTVDLVVMMVVVVIKGSKLI